MFSTRRRALWSVALCGALAIGSLIVARERRYAAAQDAVRQTLAVRHSVSETLSLLKDAETGQRGFLLTGDGEFLSPYVKAQRGLPGQLAHLLQLVHDDARQSANAHEIRRLAEARLEVLAQTIELRRQGRSDEVLKIVRGRGRQLMDSLRTQTDRMLARTASEVGTRESVVRDARIDLDIAIGIACVFVLCLIADGFWSTSRSLVEAKRANERLQNAEKELRAIADHASDLVRVIGNDAELLYVSPSCEAILGYSQAELIEMPPRALLPEEERDDAYRLTLAVRANHAPHEPFVHRLRTKGGALRWFETKYRLISGAPGDAHVHLTSRDITDRKLAEEGLRKQTARLESILSSMGDGVVVLDQNRRFLIVNPAARDYIRQDEGEQAPSNWSQLHRTFLFDGTTPFPSDQGPLTRALQGEASDAVELVICDRNDSPRAFSVTARPIYDQGSPAGCVAVYRDITERQRAEREIQESEGRLRVLAEASFEGVLIGKGGAIVDANEMFASWVGRTRAELIGTKGLSLFAPEDHERLLELRPQSGVYYEAQMLRKDGTRFPVEVRGRNTTFRGETVRIAVIRDITDKRQREAELKEQAELLRAMSLRDDLTGLYNRRGFQEHARQSMRNVARTGRPACVFFADLNGLKSINDTLGHDVGDRAIVATARVLSTVFRESDIVARLGGDEFAIFALHCAAQEVAGVRARLRDQVEELNRQGAQPFQLSVSLGSAVFEPGSASDLDSLMEAADRAMYQEKRAQQAV